MDFGLDAVREGKGTVEIAWCASVHSDLIVAPGALSQSSCSGLAVLLAASGSMLGPFRVCGIALTRWGAAVTGGGHRHYQWRGRAALAPAAQPEAGSHAGTYSARGHAYRPTRKAWQPNPPHHRGAPADRSCSPNRGRNAIALSPRLDPQAGRIQVLSWDGSSSRRERST